VGAKIDDYLIEELEFDLASSDLDVQRHALISLSRLPRTKQVFEVFKRVMTQEGNPEIQYLARRFYNEWRENFEEKPVEVKADVYLSGEIDEAEVRNSFVGKNPRLKIDICQQITEKGDKKALPLIVDALDNEQDPFVIATLVKGVGTLGDACHITVLQTYLKHADSRVRANTVEALELIGDDLIFPVLVPMLQDPDNRVKGNTIKALLNYDEEGARDLIWKLARSSRESRRDSACYCVRVSKRPWGEDILLEMLQREDVLDLLKKECDMLAEFGTEKIIGPLSVQLMRSPSENARLLRFAIKGVQERLGLSEDKVNLLKAAHIKEQDVLTQSGAHEPMPAPGAAAKGKPASEVEDTSRWDMDVVADMLPKLKSKVPMKGALSSPTTRKFKTRQGGERRQSGKTPGQALKEQAAWLVPAVLGGVLLVTTFVLLISSVLPGAKDAISPTRRSQPAGANLNIECLVRFVDKRKASLTVASGDKYYLARFPKGTEFKGIKGGTMVRLTGRMTDEKHFDAKIIECTSVEKLEPLSK